MFLIFKTTAKQIVLIAVRYFLSLLLLITIIEGCSKNKTTERTNFLEFTVGGKKIEFSIKDTVLLDTASQTFWNFSINDNTSARSSLVWVLYSTSKWVNGDYEYPGGYQRSINYMNLSTYVNGPMESYYLANLYHNPFKITIDQSENGRLHGTFSGTMTCSSCATPGAFVKITSGEFEMAYSFR